MRRAAFLLSLIAMFACRKAEPPKPHAARTDIRTIEAADPRPAVLDPPPVLPDEAAAPKPKDAVAAQNMVPLTEQDEQVRAKLPFAPAIGLDPVDGSKISIRSTTPMVDMKNRVFYFSSEENKRLFLADPAQYMKGVFK
jgi:YHS domain-containing protein